MHNYFMFVFILAVEISAAEELYHLVVEGKGNYRAVRMDDVNPRVNFHEDEPNVLVKALYSSAINKTGWAFLQLNSNGNYDDEEQAYGAGYLEARITKDLIYMSWYNTLRTFCTDRQRFCSQIENFVDENIKWVKSNVEKFGDDDDYWHQIKLYYRQIDGIAEGYQDENDDPARTLSPKDILWLNTPDLDDIFQFLLAKENNFAESDFGFPKILLGLGHCSALIKILSGGSDLLVGHVTWNGYESMLRILKKYSFDFRISSCSEAKIPGHTMSFSSYPGVVTSGDDFYLMSSGLVALETTIGNSNSSLWKYVSAEGQVSEGARSMVANRLALDGRSWFSTFSRLNSGTYNNQWMILDYDKFKTGTPPEALPADLLWVVEQIPNTVYGEDATPVLRSRGYWPSYNVPYYKAIFDSSGHSALAKRYGNWFTYENTPRALIFKRDEGKVTSVNSMMSLMRYNNFKKDPLSKCACNPPYSAENAISSRNDLNPINGTYPFPALGHRCHGGTDAKITSSELFLNGLRFLAVSGPARHPKAGIPPFQWSTSDFNEEESHMGHPDLWTFKPLIRNWA